jgi:anaerobic selenocysteine-containing dehydrogenase
MNKTTCPLDCYDACSVIFEDGKLKGDPDHPLTQGFLCPSLNSFLKQKRVTEPCYNGTNISMDEALEILSSTLKKSQKNKTLLFKGSGNMGKMQDVTNLFFEKYGATFTEGSLCDGAGDAGIVEGRGVNLALPISQIEKSDVVVVWGRNISTTNAHMQKVIKNKTLIVIDPVKTKLAKKADVHVQLKPRTDFFLAILWARFAHLEEMEDFDFIESHTEYYEDFVDFFRGFGIKYLLDEVDVTVKTIMSSLTLMKDKKVSFLVGVGVQKYLHGDGVLRAIDSLAAMLGQFGKEGCGVSYLSNSSYGFANPFTHKASTVSKPTVKFEAFDTVFIQGGNPASQMPDSNRVCEGLKNSDFVVYFGLYENESSSLANLVIPAKTFLEKEDVRLSYGSEFVGEMPKLVDSDIGISEYALTQFLQKSFGYESLRSEKEYGDEILNSNAKEVDGYLHASHYDEIPYRKGFYTESEKFIFMDEIEDEKSCEEEGYFLVTSKPRNSINSQFERDNYLYIASENGFEDGDRVKVTSPHATTNFIVKISDDLRADCIKICSGAEGLNILTPSLKSNFGNSAVFQEVILNLEKV